MEPTLSFLKDFEYYCINENALENQILERKPAGNFKRMMRELDFAKSKPRIADRYSANINSAETLVTSFQLVHNTDLNCLISIIRSKELLSINNINIKDIPFNCRITSFGIQDEMHKYVFCGTPSGDWINGLCEIKFKNRIERLPGAKFLPQSHLCYESEGLSNHWMELGNWRRYLAEYIAVNYERVEDYIRNTPAYKRPEFLFEDSIPFSYVEEIKCATFGAYSELIRILKQEYGPDTEVLKKIKYLI
jgi:hypothetical protein